jgi:hypothetical protein
MSAMQYEATGKVLSLDVEEADVLRFILDETIERWEDQSEGQLRTLSGDMYKSLDQELDVFQFLAGLPNLVRQIRKRLE